MPALVLGADGNRDTSFDHGGFNSIVFASAQQSDGKIIAAGFLSSFNGTGLNRIARLNTDGTLDTSFNVSEAFDANKSILTVVVQSDGKILAGGEFSSFGNASSSRIIRFNSDGSLDGGFDVGDGFNGSVYSLALQDDGKILVGGNFTSYDGVTRNRIARLNDDGSLDTSFDPSTNLSSYVYSIVIQPDDKILVGGNFTPHIARLNADGSLDDSFDPGTGFNFNYVKSMALQDDGKIIAIGDFSSFNGTSRGSIARLNTDGSLDGTWTGDFDSALLDDVLIQPDGKVLVSGCFESYNGATFGTGCAGGIIRINTDSTLDTSFDAGGSFDDEVSTMTLQDDGKVVIGGWFREFGGVAANRIARLEAYTAPESTPTSNPHPHRTFSPVYSIGSYISSVASSSAATTTNVTTPTTTISVTIPPVIIASTPTFTTDLYFGMVDPEVRLLQKYLNTHGFIVTTTGNGSPGQEINRFGPATRAALVKFQKANKISPSAGYFGPLTRGYVNSHL
jgi:uncharacterized delta-60 repeat protein